MLTLIKNETNNIESDWAQSSLILLDWFDNPTHSKRDSIIILAMPGGLVNTFQIHGIWLAINTTDECNLPAPALPQ